MALYRNGPPQLKDAVFLTDGGIETTLIFHEGLELPSFASFILLKDDAGRRALRRYFAPYGEIARLHKTGFILESPTWRANQDWGAKLGYFPAALAEANRQAIALMEDVRAEYQGPDVPFVISGCIGPRGDGYKPGKLMGAEEAERYHGPQVETLAGTAADFVTALTMNYVEEAIGITRAALARKMPVAVSFTVETDGKLPSGDTLQSAIAKVDHATGRGPIYYMINCAHPTHFGDALRAGEPWMQRIRGIRANASTKSHAELDEATTLDAGNPAELGTQYRALCGQHRHLTVLGGCCGTDDRHIAAIAKACLGQA